MKKSKWFILLAIALAPVIVLNAQRIKLTDGDLSPLKSEKSIAFAFTYDNMTMGGRGHQTEAEYVSKKTEEYNKKTPGKGDEWAKAWKDDREGLYEPAFTKVFEKYGSLEPDPKAKYLLIFKTTYTEPGYNIGVMRHNAEISGDAWIVEAANKDHVIAKISVIKAQGGSYFENDFATDERISSAYEAAGRALGYFIKGKM